MATDVERLVVQISADLRRYENAMKRAQGITNQTARQIESRFQRMNRTAAAGFARIGARVGGVLGGALLAREAQQLIDAATRIDNALKVAGLSGEELEKVYGKLRDSAVANAAPLESLVELYGRAALVQKELGVSSEELLRFTNNVAVALRVSGKSAAEASGALLQLSQALGSGVVRAEEFNSILEGAPTIAQAAAAGLKEAGGSVARLRQLVIDGKISSEAFFRAFEAGAPTLAEKVRSSNLTIGQAMDNLRTSLVDAARDFEKATGAGNAFAGGINNVARAIAGFDVTGFIGKIRAVRTELERMLNAAGNASLFEELAEALLGRELTKGAPIALDTVEAEDEIENLERQVRILTDRIEANKEMEIDTTEAQQQLDRILETIRQAKTELADPTGGRGFVVGTPGDPNALAGAGSRTVSAAVVPVSLEDLAAPVEKAADGIARATNEINQALIQTARQFDGFNENAPSDRTALSEFFKSANQNVDPKMTAWCAAFVNAVLATNGLPGTGALNARSFLDYGKPTQDPQPGDLVILKRGSGNVQGHVGFFMGDAANGGVRVLGGNQGNEVSTQTFNSADVLGFRQVDGELQSAALERQVELRRQQLEIVRQLQEAGQTENARIQLETALVGASNAEREKQMFIFERLNELQQNGIPITEELRASVEREAAARYSAVAANEAATASYDQLISKQQELNFVQQEISGAFQGALKGLISDLISGKDATEALINAVSRLADRLLDIALNQLFASIFGGGIGGIGGGLGGIAAGLFHGGGVAGAAVVSRRVHPAVFAGARRMHSGGIAGDEVPTILKRGEIIIPRAKARDMVRGRSAAPNVDARTTVINRFDAAGVVSEALSQPAGVKVVLNVIRNQPGAFRQALGV